MRTTSTAPTCSTVASFLTLLCTLFLLTLLTGTARASLQAVGPTDPVTTLPSYYLDPSNLAIQPCLDQNGFCVLPPAFDPAITTPPTPITTTGPISGANFPDEIFYFLCDSKMNVNGDIAVLRIALEAAFLNGVTPNTGIPFLRINLQRMVLTPNSTYTVTHPYGSFQFTTDAAGKTPPVNGQAFRAEDPLVPSPGIYFPPEMQAATTTHIGPFLKGTGGLIVDPISGNTYLGNPLVTTAVTGSPTGNNFFRIDGPNIGGPGINTIQTNQFNLSGRLYTQQIPAPLAIDRATYARDATSGQIDLFASASSTAILSVSGTGLTTTAMAQDAVNAGKFFATLPFATLPAGVNITNSLDVPPVPHPVTLEDEVNISQAVYNPVSRSLLVRAVSRDRLPPLPTLSVPAYAPPNTLDATGLLTLPLPLNTIPPMEVQVVSSRGGSAIAPVSVVIPPAAPVAANDAASTTAGTPVTIDVLLNDSSAAGLDPASVSIVALSPNGSAVVNPGGSVTFTPAAGFSGTTSFGYEVKDIYAQLSNTATVTVTVLQPTAPAPTAVADSATTLTGSAVTINVLANDTIGAPGVIDPASVLITGQPLNGTASVNPTGTVTFTPAAGFTGTTTFAYTVANTSNPALVSNAATVTVTVTPPPPAPVAVADSATTPAGSAVTINVLANDTIGAPGVIDPASVLIATQSLNGTATANPAGTVTFTPAAGFAGTTTFAYTVANSSNPPLTSNAATVTVTVTAPPPAPVAVADSATTPAGSAVTINVLANDTIGAPGVINPASVLITTQSLNGTATANPTGTVTFTPAAGFTGTTTFAYTVANTSTPPLASNPATVTVTVTAVTAPAPVAVADTASTRAGTAVTINVLANDTIAAPGVINPASVTITTAPLNGTAVVNPTGTVTFTPAAGFTGTATFAYTVANSSIPPLTSNAATVTVTVTAAQTINVTRAEYTRSTGSWRVDGSLTPAPPAGTTLTFYNNPTVGVAPLVTTIGVAGNGSFTWTSANGFPAPNALNKMSIQSNQNAATKLENITVILK